MAVCLIEIHQLICWSVVSYIYHVLSCKVIDL